MLGLLRQNTFYIRISKCSFEVTYLIYLGHIVSADGMQPDPDKIEAVRAWPAPNSVRQVCTFLGLTGYYRRFIARYAQLAAPLTDLLRKTSFIGT